MEFAAECIDKLMADPERILHDGTRRAPSLFIIIRSRVKIKPEISEIRVSRKLFHIGLFVEKTDDRLLETMTFLVPDIPGIPAVAALIPPG